MTIAATCCGRLFYHFPVCPDFKRLWPRKPDLIGISCNPSNTRQIPLVPESSRYYILWWVFRGYLRPTAGELQ